MANVPIKYIELNPHDLQIRRSEINQLISIVDSFGMSTKFFGISGFEEIRQGGWLQKKGIELYSKVYNFRFRIFKKRHFISYNSLPTEEDFVDVVLSKSGGGMDEIDDMLVSNGIKRHFTEWLKQVKRYIEDLFLDIRMENVHLSKNLDLSDIFTQEPIAKPERNYPVQLSQTTELLSEVADLLKQLRDQNQVISVELASRKVTDIVMVKPAFLGVELNVNELVRRMASWIR